VPCEKPLHARFRFNSENILKDCLERCFVPKMVKNGYKSVFACLSL
jgi:hypothetical protein